jgi:hypothetical protein
MSETDLLSRFTTRFDPPSRPADGVDKAGEEGDQPAPGDAYRTVNGPRAAVALEYVWKDGASVSVPYGYLPLVWWAGGAILVEYPNLFAVRLRGHNLSELKRRLRDHRLTRVREFDPLQAAALPEAVTQIELLAVALG